MASIKECLDRNDECYLIVFDDDNGWYHAQVSEAENWLGGEGLEGYMDDSGAHFNNSQECQSYYNRYFKVEAFDFADDWQKRIEELEANE